VAVADLVLVRSVRASPFLALVCLVVPAVAEDHVAVVLLESTDANGRKVEFRSDTKTLLAAPQWALSGDGRDDPPLSVAAAAKIARDAGMRMFPSSDGVSFGSVQLARKPLSYPRGGFIAWFYVFSLEPVFPTGPATIRAGPDTKIVVLMDGTVVPPTPAKQI